MPKTRVAAMADLHFGRHPTEFYPPIFAQANNDIGEILTSTSKVVRRGQRIDELDLDEEPQAVAPVIPERKVSGGLF